MNDERQHLVQTYLNKINEPEDMLVDSRKAVDILNENVIGFYKGRMKGNEKTTEISIQ